MVHDARDVLAAAPPCDLVACVASCFLAHIGERVFFFEPLCWVVRDGTAR